MENEELTEQETALYDRQIRVWGVDAQRRLSKSHILVSGVSGTIIEFCKNIVLAGVGSLTLMDDRMVTVDAISANFLFPPDEDMFRGKSLAEVCCDALKDFNPMVHVSVQKGDLSSFDGDFYDKFSAVVVNCCSLPTKRLINEKCRKRPKRIAFYTLDCRDSCGEIFIDLQNYIYEQKKLDGTVECQLQYPSFETLVELGKLGVNSNLALSCSIPLDLVCESVTESTKEPDLVTLPVHPARYVLIFEESKWIFGCVNFDGVSAPRRSTLRVFLYSPFSCQEAVAVHWSTLPRKVSKVYFGMRDCMSLIRVVIEKFEEAEGRKAGETSIADLPSILKLKKELCQAESFNEYHIPDSLLQRLLMGTMEHPPVCAIIGGILGQEVIKAISGKGDPLKNFFFFDAMDGKGIIEDIGSTNTEPEQP
ncbi:hypothetical protein IFM89_000563 [Coptis chinensis]|uniref:THIF-type NAD/FAD binding fold domain-containing protein n=1 Tax=Coptis chinensis TaxID=261450 RepID=A0A835M3V8_9MAGN|nr:hypothetical protein IFM89_000563 [Coptis chinensis]